ncbi:MAG: energy-coupling factor ABC transporter ATP-binding protein [Candidatus Thiodiazotropha sp. (ex Dulcina madagascariensis)]|nr:energy-coupling factor ABC transporter ATP-binding protein [Candidatus Thiodiazotropha sp. (ex Dulcina madagascariensis)]
MIELDGVGFTRPDGPRVLQDLTLRVETGEKLVLLGANGCGKSTLLKLLNGLLFPTSGRYLYRGDEVTKSRVRTPQWARRFRREMVLLFQYPEAMLFNPTVADEIGYGPRQLGLADSDQRVTAWARRLDLEPLLKKPPYALSGGEKQKVALAALLALDPQCLLLDEPMANLDPRSSGWLVDYLLETVSTVIVSTHNLSMAAELGERCLVLDAQGTICFDGAVTQALEDMALLQRANLVHRDRHRHGPVTHSHPHSHDWE